ncbi:MAG TPA: T9SS type A sorting domain-containing protein [Candidatus Cloacimonadota bacterium]|nr:T9SS type A sorting domain-containing protein [Candidatus Cloacimonadota bacterium]HPM02358.1 T9SS type A sorting domain-containing protein [Candidatus Cloacimonadota bacterium]
MKQIIIGVAWIFLFIISLSAEITQISNIRLDRHIVDYDSYNGAVNMHNNHLYVENKGKIEEYNIMSDGNLERISFLEKGQLTGVTSFIEGDSLYYFERDDNSYLMSVIDISVSPMRFVGTIDTEINRWYSMTKAIYKHYILLSDNEHEKIRKLNRFTLDYEGEHQNIYGIFTVVDSVLILYGSINNGNNEIYSLRFFNLNQENINYPNGFFHEEVLSDNEELDIVYLKHKDNLLYVLGFDYIKVFDIHNISNLHTIYTLHNSTPSYWFYYTDALLINNKLFTADINSQIKVYDIQNSTLVYQEQNTGNIQYGTFCLNYPYLYSNNDHFLAQYQIEDNIQCVRKYGIHYLYSAYKDNYAMTYDPINKYLNFYSIFDNMHFSIYKEGVERFLNIDVYDGKLYVRLKINGQTLLEIYSISENQLQLINTITFDTYPPSWFDIIGNYIYFYCYTGQNFITRVYRIAENDIEYHCTFNGYPQISSGYISNEYIYTYNNGHLSFRDINAPENILFSYPIQVPNNYGTHREISINQDYMALSDQYAYLKIFNMNNNTLIPTFSANYPENSSQLTLYNEILSIYNSDSSSRSIYYTGNGALNEIGIFESRVSSSDYYYPDLNKMISSSSSGINLYSFDYTVSTDDQTLAKPTVISVYPNPCRSDLVKFSVTNNTKVKNISVYNIKGQLVNKLGNEAKQGNGIEFIWDKKDMNGKTVSSGLYLYRADSEQGIISGKMMILK